MACPIRQYTHARQWGIRHGWAQQRACVWRPQQRRYTGRNRTSSSCPQQSRSRRFLSAAVAACLVPPLASIAAQSLQPGAAAATGAGTLIPGITSVAVLIICSAAAVFLLAAIPVLWAMTRTAQRMESLLRTLEEEVPGTAASLRLSGMELSDCLAELSGLSNDVSGGLRAGARLVTGTEQLVKGGASAVAGRVVPALAAQETKARGAVEAHLVARARLPATLPEISAGLRQTTVAVRRLRVGLLAARVAGACITAGATLKQQMVYTAYQRLREEQQQWQRRQQRRQEAAEDSDWEQGGGFEGVPVQEGAAVAGRVVVAAAGVTAAAEPTQRQRD